MSAASTMIGVLVLSLVALSLSNPIITSSTEAPIITPAPTAVSGALHRRDDLSTIPVSSCVNYADPHDGINSVCQCSGFDGFIPAQTDGLCSYTAITTDLASTWYPTPSTASLITTTSSSCADPGFPTDGPGYKPCYNGGWLDVSNDQCDNEIFKDSPGPSSQYEQRWTAANADEAWNNLIDNWRTYVATERSDDEVEKWPFYRFAAFFFGHSALDLDCAEPQSNANCPIFNCADFPHIGGWLIMQSIHNIWASFNTLSDALHKADTDAIGQMGDFQEAFAPKQDDSGLQVALAMMGALNSLAFSFAGAAFDFADHEITELAVEGLNTLTETGIEFGKQWADSLESKDEAAIIATLNSMCTHIWDGTDSAMGSSLRDLMGGDAEALHENQGNNAPNLIALLNLVSRGAMLATDDHYADKMRAQALTMIYAGLMRATWQEKNNAGYPNAPYILYVPASVYKCGDDPSTASLIPGDSEPLTNIVNADDASKRSYCDPDGNSYFLMSGTTTSLVPSEATNTLYGGDTDSLSASAWGGITIESITQSAFNGFINNNFQNGFDLNTGSAQNYLQDWTQGKLTGDGAFVAPGFFNFPICFSVDSVDTNFRNWYGDPADPVRDGVDVPLNYPCQEGSHADSTGFIDAYKKKHGLE